MQKNFQTMRGSALLESILGVALLGLFFTILMGSVTYLEQSTLRAKAHTEALLLAEEGIEAVRSMRNRDFALLAEGDHGLTRINNIWEFDGESDVSPPYTRSIIINALDASTTRVLSKVEWGDAGPVSDVTLEAHFTNWRLPN